MHLWCHFWNIQILIALHLEGLESLLDMEMLWSLKYWEKQYHFINIYPGTEILGSLKKYFAHLWCHFHFSLLFKIFFQQKFDRMKRYRKSHKTRSKIIDLAQKFCTLVVQKEIIVVKNTRLNKFSLHLWCHFCQFAKWIWWCRLLQYLNPLLGVLLQ